MPNVLQLELTDDDVLVLRDRLLYGNVGRSLEDIERMARLLRTIKNAASRIEKEREADARSNA